MSLLIDGNISTINDLTEFESSLTGTAATEGIDLLTKLSIAKLEISLAIQKFLMENYDWPQAWLDVGFPINSGYTINNVTVTSGLKQWHVLQTIAAVYRDAFNQQLNDRYKGKWMQYANLAADASNIYFANGIGLCLQPMTKPAAPLLSQVAGKAQGLTWFAQTSWVNARNQESAAGDLASFSTRDESFLTASIANPPIGAVGWNIYAGLTSTELYKQNQGPILLNQPWTMTAPFQSSGDVPKAGQEADTILRKRNVLRRG